MGFTQAVSTVFRKYATFDGRARRSEYWWWELFMLLVALALAGLTAVSDLFQPIGGLVSLLLFLPNIAVTVRRLHDTDRSGWFLLLAFIPVIGALLLLWWFIQRGTVGPNRFGPDPA